MDDVFARGMAFYDDRLKSVLEADHLGEVVAVEPTSGAYALGSDSDRAIRAARAQGVRGLLFVRRIGSPTEEDRRFAARIAAAEANAK